MNKTAMRLSQMELVSAILNEINRQIPDATLPPARVLNLICSSATEIVREAAIEFRGASEGMGLHAWLKSDDTGLSSKFMAHVLYGGPKCEMNYPHDANDFGRCERLLKACGEPEPSKWLDLLQYPEWRPWVAKMKGLS